MLRFCVCFLLECVLLKVFDFVIDFLFCFEVHFAVRFHFQFYFRFALDWYRIRPHLNMFLFYGNCVMSILGCRPVDQCKCIR